MKINSFRSRLSLVAFIISAFTGFASFADEAGNAGKSFPFSELGQKAAEKADSSSLGIRTVAGGAEIVCKLQAIEASVTASGISIKSTSKTEGGGKFNMKVAGLGRGNNIGRDGSPSRPFLSGGFGETAPPSDKIVKVSNSCAQIIHPELAEEYTVSGDGIRQDFIVSKKPEGNGELVLAVGLGGATAELADYGLEIRLAETGREFAYSKLLVTDASGRHLPAEFKLNSPNEFIVAVNDSGAVYPVRIDPTISDANWVNMWDTGTNYSIDVFAYDSSGNLYAGGTFTNAGGVSANRVAKWDGNSWSALGEGIDGTVYALACDRSGNLYAGGIFSAAGGMAANYIAKWNGTAWS
ncbi:MAG: hypothetical protein NT118_09205, partial [Lentisphaerae bacterium]|nr:hypothetical protein [Lentisphaerota bacterium]